jgi:hypothetical protein
MEGLHMTAIAYPDLTVTSPGNRVRLEIRSPDNDLVNPRSPESLAAKCRGFWGGFQDDFVYTARAVDTGEVIWRRAQPPDEPSPRATWIDDDGRAVVQTVDPFFSHLMVFAPPDGRRTLVVDVAPLLSEREYQWTSAGSMWESGGHGYMLALGGRPHWCVRLLRGRRLLIDLDRPALVEAADHIEALERAERGWAFATLQRLVPMLDEWERCAEPDAYDAMHDIRVAANLAGKLGVRSAVPLLQRLERSPLESGYTTARWPPAPHAPDGRVEIAFLAFRQIAAMSLRRLGVEPAGYANHVFRPTRDWAPDEDTGPLAPIPLPECLAAAADRAARAGRVTAGMSPWDVLHLLGSPQHLWGRGGWDFDFGVRPDDGYTLQVRWSGDENPRVVTTERVRPARWIACDDRDDWA